MLNQDREILGAALGRLPSGLYIVTAGNALGHPFAMPPGVPADRLAALRKALPETLKDGEFLAEAQKIGMSISPVSAQDIQLTMEALSKKSKSFYEEVKRISE